MLEPEVAVDGPHIDVCIISTEKSDSDLCGLSHLDWEFPMLWCINSTSIQVVERALATDKTARPGVHYKVLVWRKCLQPNMPGSLDYFTAR